MLLRPEPVERGLLLNLGRMRPLVGLRVSVDPSSRRRLRLYVTTGRPATSAGAAVTANDLAPDSGDAAAAAAALAAAVVTISPTTR